jgi:hypothetical protein
VDEFALEFLREQHRPRLLAHLVEKVGTDPWTFPANDLDPLDPDAMLPVLVECPCLPLGEDISISRPFETASIGSSVACIASLAKAASSLMISFCAE